MNLKHAAKLELLIRIITFIIFLPLVIIRYILLGLAWPFDILLEYDTYFCDWVGGKLLQNSEEVKNGEIKNDYAIRTYTARYMYAVMKKEKNIK